MTNDEIGRRGLMLVLSSPSGAGKTSIARRLLDEEANIVMSVSATTRPSRKGEIEGVDYYFTDNIEFNMMVNRGEMLEHAKVFDHYYGTPAGPVTEALNDQIELFEVERLRNVVLENAGRSAAEIVEAVRAHLADFMVGAPQADDITIVVVKLL